MQELYGIVGSGSAPRKVIEASLNDIGASSHFIVPWYGRVTSGLEVVYDWVLDNEATFTVVATEGTKAVPKALAAKASSVENAPDVDKHILSMLKERPVRGLALVMWDDDKVPYSIEVSSMAINFKLATLELTNGMVPIILDEDSPEAHLELVVSVATDDLPEIGDASYDLETLEMMPTALVKRMAKDKGFDPKSKDEAIKMLSTSGPIEEIGSILILMKNGTELGFTATSEILQKIFEVVVNHQSK